ncbi:MAG: DUF3106 domain-containing protein [Acidobacteria bacterium]|nr:DUF3106 domain-containing protein [Acidobacteriota bacterium]
MFRAIAVTILLSAGVYGQRPAPRPGAVRPGPARRAAVLERWNEMSPEERQKRLEKLPPERRQRIEENLERYRNLPPEEKERLRNRVEIFSHLPPARQEQARRLFRRFNMLPLERQQPLREEFQKLRGMPAGERRSYMDSEEFHNRYNAHEREMLHELTGLLSQ